MNTRLETDFLDAVREQAWEIDSIDGLSDMLSEEEYIAFVTNFGECNDLGEDQIDEMIGSRKVRKLYLEAVRDQLNSVIDALIESEDYGNI